MGLSHPIRNKALDHLECPQDGMEVGASEMHGYRDDMEDEHVLVHSLPHHPAVSLFAVLDGHAGNGAARHVAHTLAPAIDALGSLTVPNVRSCIAQLDRGLLERAIPLNDTSGTTLAFALVHRSHGPAEWDEDAGRQEIFPAQWFSVRDAARMRPEPRTGSFSVLIGSVGDSRCIVGQGPPPHRCEQVTEDHRPSLLRERRRVREAGGFIQGDRVSGQLAVTRALGDYDYKIGPSRTPNEPPGQHVIAVPDLFVRRVCPGDFLLLACDGIFERLESNEVGRFVAEHLARSPPAQVCAALLEHSLDSGSRDNMTAVLVRLTERTPSSVAWAAPSIRREYVWDRFAHWEKEDSHRISYQRSVSRYGLSIEQVRSAISAAGSPDGPT